MTTDPVKRVARAFCEAAGNPRGLWSEMAGHDQAYAKLTVNYVLQALTDQGIPIDKLLSGEMVAVYRNPDWSQGIKHDKHRLSDQAHAAMMDTKDTAVEP